MALDPLATRVTDRHLLAKVVLLKPAFAKAIQAFKNREIKPIRDLIQQVIDIILPGGTGHPPPWYYALGTAKRNTLNWLQKEGHSLLRGLPTDGELAAPDSPDSRFHKHPDPEQGAAKWVDYYVMLLEAWGKKLRTLEIAAQAEDEEKHIKHGPFTIVRVSGLTQTDVDGSLEALDAATDAIRPKFPQVLYGFVYLSPHLGANQAANYANVNDTVQLNVRIQKRFSHMQTLIHEFGHRFDYKFFRKNKELREKFVKLSTQKVMETLHYDEKLRRAVADEAIQIAKARRDGTQMPASISADLARWGVGAGIKSIMTGFVNGKFTEEKAHADIMGPVDRNIETGKVLHGPLHVTPYGGTDPKENFAEAFAFYVLGLPMPAELVEIMAQL